MTIRRFPAATAATLLFLLPMMVAGQRPPTAPMIVVFHDDAPFGTFPAGRAEARARANAAAWAYLDRGVLGTVQTIEAQYGVRADHVYSAAIRGFAARLNAAQIDALRRHPFVASIEEDGTMVPFEQVLPWGIDRIEGDLSSVHSGDSLGEVTGVNVYVLDTGVELTHPDLNVVNHVNFTSSINEATCAHGTRVSGVLAARDNGVGVVGVLPGAPITGVKVVACDPIITWTSTAIKGVDWVTANAVRPAVANMSIGGFVSFALDAAVKRSADSGVFYVIAAGNSATDACWTSPQRAGTHPGVMTIAATEASDDETVWSSFGRCVDLWAPGSSIHTSDLGGGTVTSLGTSYAAPHVGGTGGLVLLNNPAATPAEVESALKASAVVTGAWSKDFRLVRRVYAGAY